VINKKKFQDPSQILGVTFHYEGDIDGYQFKTPHFQEQYDMIQNKLSYNKRLKYITVSIAPYQTKPSHTRYTFIARSENDDVIWYKYSQNSVGSDYNKIYIDGVEQSTANFLKT
jgi:hypothetical protein